MAEATGVRLSAWYGATSGPGVVDDGRLIVDTTVEDPAGNHLRIVEPAALPGTGR
ncbi:hypothetical protein [Actinomadura sp. DC4]|uniref:hypothetical protein n=1 Tax=Actinomadura sp. DC4 TaxID=3055069 RepID=UPI0025AF8A18|nr:hypothetical protein [Actinomadura sp. DC4]MDN3356804.1 hypothetical protein [Actinomadura sp. DC4]